MSLSLLAGPLIGAVIGYFTNYLAVKMLFRPRNEVRIGSWTVPMTPGVIPKGKSRLARAIGKAISENLLTEDELSKHLLNEDTVNAVTDKAVDFLNHEIREDVIAVTGVAEEEYDARRDKVVDSISSYVSEEVNKLPIKDEVTRIIVEGAKEKLGELAAEGGMIAMVAMMLPEGKIRELAEPLGWKAEQFINENAYGYIQPVLHDKVSQLEQERPMDILNDLDLEDSQIRDFISKTYRNLISDNIGRVMEHLDIAGMVENKINEMSVEELETLVLSVMNKELNMIVRLGALIGFVIGTVNVFI